MAEYIEREAALECLKKYSSVGHDGTETYKTYCAEIWGASLDIYNLPAADVAPVVHAKWVFNGICTSCSACGSNKPTKAHDHKLASREVRFCYFCGAKMDLEESK